MSILKQRVLLQYASPTQIAWITTDALLIFATQVPKYVKKRNEVCSNCEWLSIEIIPDNYPEETTWYLRNYENNELILSGDPYSKFSIAHGRKKNTRKKNARKKNARKKNGR